MKIVLYLFVQIVQAVSRDTHWLEKLWLLCCSHFDKRNTCIQQTKSVLLPVAIVLHGAYRKCSIHHCAALLSPLLVHVSAIVDERSRNFWFHLQHFFSYSANSFFLFVDASKNTGESPGLLLGATCDMHYGQISPYHQLCLVGNTFTATRPADLWGAWCVHLVLQTMDGKLAKIAIGQKRLATYLTTKAGLQESINVYLRLVSSMKQPAETLQADPKWRVFLSAFDSRPKLEKSDTSWPSPKCRWWFMAQPQPVVRRLGPDWLSEELPIAG